jgi:hypothetical protein
LIGDGAGKRAHRRLSQVARDGGDDHRGQLAARCIGIGAACPLAEKPSGGKPFGTRIG